MSHRDPSSIATPPATGPRITRHRTPPSPLEPPTPPMSPSKPEDPAPKAHPWRVPYPDDDKEAEERDRQALRDVLHFTGPDLAQLKGFVPIVDQTPFEKEFKLEWLDDNFFGMAFEDLLIMINRIVAKYFKAVKDFPANLLSAFSIPPISHGDTSLEQYIQKIARPCMSWPWTWDAMLSRDSTRQNLLVGLLMRIMDDQIFSRLLFGAGQTATECLWRQDHDFIMEDGFSRTRLRAATVRMFLQQDGGMPKHFSREVDTLTFQILAQLHPIMTYMETGGSKFDLKELYQELYTTVHFAGWLAVQARRSDSIITFDWPTPGDRFDQTFHNVGRNDLQLSEMYAGLADRHRGVDPLRTARIMTAVCPLIQRYTPDVEGQIKFRVLRAKVACYWGHFDDYDDQEEFETKLEGHPHDSNLVEYTRVRRQMYADFRHKTLSKEKQRTWWGFFLMLIGWLLAMFVLGISLRVVYWAWTTGRERWTWDNLSAAIQAAGMSKLRVTGSPEKA